MTIKIDRKIIKYQVQKPEEQRADKPAPAAGKAADAKSAPEAGAAAQAGGETELVRDKNGHRAKVIRMHERLEGPEGLPGSPYKNKQPMWGTATDGTTNDA